MIEGLLIGYLCIWQLLSSSWNDSCLTTTTTTSTTTTTTTTTTRLNLNCCIYSFELDDGDELGDTHPGIPGPRFINDPPLGGGKGLTLELPLVPA